MMDSDKSLRASRTCAGRDVFPTVQPRERLAQPHERLELPDGDPVRRLRSGLRVPAPELDVRLHDLPLCVRGELGADGPRVANVPLQLLQGVVHLDGAFAALVQGDDVPGEVVVVKLIWLVDHDVYEIEPR